MNYARHSFLRSTIKPIIPLYKINDKMPRSSRSSGGGRSAPSGSRGTHTMASQRPNHHQQTQPAAYNQHQNVPANHQQQQGRSPGLFGQMASTAAGVAVGSTMGHGLSNMLFGGGGGGSSAESIDAQQQQQQQPAQWDQQGQQSSFNGSGVSCEVQSKDFLRCLEATNNNMDSCAFYLDQLKACQAAARPY